MKSCYELLGKDRIEHIISMFYKKAFNDPIIGHFFFRVDQQHLIKKQILFTSSILGGPVAYKGKTIKIAHDGLKINSTHFNRRQILMEETLVEAKVPKKMRKIWLEKELRLKNLVIKSSTNCNS